MRTTKNKKIYEKIANNTNLSPKEIKEIYESMFGFIKDRLREVDCLGEKTEEEMEELRLSFNIPLIGKFYITYDSIQRLKNKIKYLNEHCKSKENQTTI